MEIVCLLPTLEIGEHGKPPVMVDPSKHCDDCHQTHEFEVCPECGSDLVISYGSNYLKKFCEKDECPWVWMKVYDDN